jgi:ribonuclease R
MIIKEKKEKFMRGISSHIYDMDEEEKEEENLSHGIDYRIRRYIVSVFQKNMTRVLHVNQIEKGFDDEDSDEVEKDSIERVLHSLVDVGYLRCPDTDEYKLNVEENGFYGELVLLRDGIWAVMPDEEDHPILVQEEYLNNALEGDYVKAMILPSYSARQRVQILQVIKRGCKQVLGRIKKRGKRYYATINQGLMSYDVYLSECKSDQFPDGQYVLISLNDWDHGDKYPVGSLIKVMRNENTREVDFRYVSQQYAVPLSFQNLVKKEVEEIKTFSREDDEPRVDLRSLPTFTLMPKIDQRYERAYSVEAHGTQGWTVYVHVTDVAHYVNLESEIGLEAYRRGNTINLIGGEIPMLPMTMCNQICALLPGEKKLAISIRLNIDNQGNVTEYEIKNSIIKSDAAFTYNEACDILEDKQDHELKASLQSMKQVAQLLCEQREKNGAILVEQQKLNFILDDNGRAMGVYKDRSADAIMMDREMTILADRMVSEYVVSLGDPANHPFIYCNISEPKKSSINQVADHIADYGFRYNTDQSVLENMQRFLSESKESSKDKNAKYPIMRKYLVDSLLSGTYYSTQYVKHYIYALDAYSKSSSPLHHYADLVNQHLLKRYLKGETFVDIEWLESICKQCNRMELLSNEIESVMVSRRQLEYLSYKSDGLFRAVVTGVFKKGIRVVLPSLSRIAFMPEFYLKNASYFYDESQNSFQSYLQEPKLLAVGESLKVAIRNVDEQENEVTVCFSYQGNKSDDRIEIEYQVKMKERDYYRLHRKE